MTGLMYPKEQIKRRKRKNRKSVLQDEKDQRCYLCMMLDEDYNIKQTEEHHVFDAANRVHSSEYGMTVRLCVKHHREGYAAVHRNKENMRLLQQIGQEAFEAEFGSREKFMEIFGRNYL